MFWSRAAIFRPPQAGCRSRTPKTACSIFLAVRLGERCGRRDRSANSSWLSNRRSHLWPVLRLIPNLSHNRVTLAPSNFAKLTNSPRSSTFEHSFQGIGRSPFGDSTYHLRSVTHVSEHVLPISPVHTPQTGEGDCLFPTAIMTHRRSWGKVWDMQTQHDTRTSIT